MERYLLNPLTAQFTAEQLGLHGNMLGGQFETGLNTCSLSVQTEAECRYGRAQPLPGGGWHESCMHSLAENKLKKVKIVVDRIFRLCDTSRVERDGLLKGIAMQYVSEFGAQKILTVRLYLAKF